MLRFGPRIPLLALATRLSIVLVLAACGGGDKSPAAPVVTPTGPGAPAALEVVSGNGQSMLAGALVPTPVVIRVRDARGNALANRSVNFAVIEGGGSVSATSGTTDANGTVVVPGWKLGPTAGAHIVQASVGALTVNAQANATSDYRIDLRFFGASATPDQQNYFINAALRIRGFVVGRTEDYQLTNVDIATRCGVTGAAPLNETANGLIIYATIDKIDGPGGILAQAGPCVTRRVKFGADSVPMPAIGFMQFDSNDWLSLVNQGNLQAVITHEMLHLVGFSSSVWLPRGLLRGFGTVDPVFTGPAALKACLDLGGSISCAGSVPVEGTGGPGTAYSHWRESVFASEMMTGFADACPASPRPCGYPISAITVGAFEDVGFTVNYGGADPFHVAGSGAPAVLPRTSP